MTQRLPNTVPTGYLCNDTVEPESNRGAHSAVIPKDETKMGAGALLERVLDRNNMNQAFKRVKQNGGSAGIDGMTVDQMLPCLRAYGSSLLEELASGKYRPQPVKRVEIPKPDGGKTSAWCTNGNRPYGSAGNRAGITTDIRADFL